MMKQYWILVSCQSEVRGASMSDMEKCRLEVQLLECKRLLLGKVVDKGVPGLVGIQQEFSALHEDFVRVCAASPIDDDVNLLVSRLNKIRRQLREGGGASDTPVY
jgi:hypothetical protein